MSKRNLNPLFCLLLTTLLLTSCKSIGLLSDKNSWLPDDIESFGDFFGIYFVLQISILLTSILLGLILGKGGYIVSLVLHFIWIVSYRDYGFFMVLLLFGLFSVIQHQKGWLLHNSKKEGERCRK
jgi:hypothetical protein